jgi:hypothetical protein
MTFAIGDRPSARAGQPSTIALAPQPQAVNWLHGASSRLFGNLPRNASRGRTKVFLPGWFTPELSSGVFFRPAPAP